MYKTGLSDKNQVVADYLPLVKRIATHLIARLPPSVQLDDLVQVGMIGLLDAANHFDSNQGAQFETYAAQRIRGAMLDELRQIDWMPRTARKQMRHIEAAVHALEQRLGRSPGEQEIAEELHLSLAAYRQALLDARGHQLLYYEDFAHGEGDSDFFEHHLSDAQDNPFASLHDEGFREALAAAIDILPEREKLVMGLYYEEELNLREIGAVLGVSESRVCQLHSQAVVRLRGRMQEWLA
ncbi:MAG TPA: RNA polymerase sigma factor FliA [Betaproteobacteria bacterium]|nr:RNA polymerase sigma factor FliA [Betaproteobacteria bacterium]